MRRHFHLIVRHRHPDWHGHCLLVRDPRHSCHRTHWHFAFWHRHTPTGR